MNLIDLYTSLSNLNPFRGIGLKKFYKKEGKAVYYYLPKFLAKNETDSWVISFKLGEKLISSVNQNKQIYFDLVVLGISSPLDRPKCKWCGKECLFIFKWDHLPPGYREYCCDCRYKTVATKNSLILSGRPLSEINKLHISLAKKGKPLTEEQRLRRPRGYHFKHTEEAKRKISLSKRNSLRTSSTAYISGTIKISKSKEVIKYLSSYERDFLLLCDSSKYVKEVLIPDAIPYKDDTGVLHNYYPDFLLILDNSEKVLVEVKPKNLKNTRLVILKQIAAKKYCYKAGIKYLMITESNIYKRKKLKDAYKSKKINFDLCIYDLFT